MSLERPYCTLANVQTETKNSESEFDALYVECINRASRWVDEYCSRDFWYHDHSEEDYLVPRGRVIGDIAFLPFKIITLTGVWVIPNHYDAKTADHKLNEKDFMFEVGKRSITSIFGDFGDFPFQGKLLLEGTFGFLLSETDPETTPPPTVPERIRRATTLIAAALSAENHKEIVSFDGNTQDMLDTGIPQEVIPMLKPFADRIESTF